MVRPAEDSPISETIPEFKLLKECWEPCLEDTDQILASMTPEDFLFFAVLCRGQWGEKSWAQVKKILVRWQLLRNPDYVLRRRAERRLFKSAS